MRPSFDSEQDRLALIIKARRLELKLSQRNLAELANTTQTAICNIEMCASNPTYKTVFNVASALGLEVQFKKS